MGRHQGADKDRHGDKNPAKPFVTEKTNIIHHNPA